MTRVDSDSPVLDRDLTTAVIASPTDPICQNMGRPAAWSHLPPSASPPRRLAASAPPRLLADEPSTLWFARDGLSSVDDFIDVSFSRPVTPISPSPEPQGRSHSSSTELQSDTYFESTAVSTSRESHRRDSSPLLDMRELQTERTIATAKLSSAGKRNLPAANNPTPVKQTIEDAWSSTESLSSFLATRGRPLKHSEVQEWEGTTPLKDGKALPKLSRFPGCLAPHDAANLYEAPAWSQCAAPVKPRRLVALPPLFQLRSHYCALRELGVDLIERSARGPGRPSTPGQPCAIVDSKTCVIIFPSFRSVGNVNCQEETAVDHAPNGHESVQTILHRLAKRFDRVILVLEVPETSANLVHLAPSGFSPPTLSAIRGLSDLTRRVNAVQCELLLSRSSTHTAHSICNLLDMHPNELGHVSDEPGQVRAALLYHG